MAGSKFDSHMHNLVILFVVGKCFRCQLRFPCCITGVCVAVDQFSKHVDILQKPVTGSFSLLQAVTSNITPSVCISKNGMFCCRSVRFFLVCKCPYSPVYGSASNLGLYIPVMQIRWKATIVTSIFKEILTVFQRAQVFVRLKSTFCSPACSLSEKADGFSWVWLKDEVARQKRQRNNKEGLVVALGGGESCQAALVQLSQFSCSERRRR